MKSIVWLASYPKSGNTWVRAFLANYQRNAETPAHINDLREGAIASSRGHFDEAIGVESSDLEANEIEQLRPAVYRERARHAGETEFIKVHDAWTRLSDGRSMVAEPAVTRAVIYLVRNPLDVAVSLAHHATCSIEIAIDRMADETHTFAGGTRGLRNQLPQRLGSWSSHVRSWLDESGLEANVVRYEDLKRDPAETFGGIVEACGLELEPARLAKAVQFAGFDVLQAQEREGPFKERSARATSFFRKGEVDDWRHTLSDAQRERLVNVHGSLMERLGYLSAHAGCNPLAKGTRS